MISLCVLPWDWGEMNLPLCCSNERWLCNQAPSTHYISLHHSHYLDLHLGQGRQQVVADVRLECQNLLDLGLQAVWPQERLQGGGGGDST